jgi:predicted site-specific integrase-resolvase
MSTFSTGKAAAYLGVGVKTLQRWDREGRLKPDRMATGRRLCTKAVRDGFLHRTPVPVARMPVAYCRVSSAARKPDLTNQGRVLEDFCAARGVANTGFVEEVGGGRNRPKFVALMDRIEAQISHLIIAHKDRPARFGFPWFERFCAEHATELLVLNQEQLSPEQEMVPDLLTIVHCFSARCGFAAL